jgi:murein DD-endopeptidase MepM/ murein hydrolase activator NlpD
VLQVTVGQRVRAGDIIALSGTTGRSTGPHVHYQLAFGSKPVDPMSYR